MFITNDNSFARTSHISQRQCHVIQFFYIHDAHELLMTQWLSLLCVVEVTVEDDENTAETTVGIVGFDSVTGADNSSCTDVAAVATMF